VRDADRGNDSPGKRARGGASGQIVRCELAAAGLRPTNVHTQASLAYPAGTCSAGFVEARRALQYLSNETDEEPGGCGSRPIPHWLLLRPRCHTIRRAARTAKVARGAGPFPGLERDRVTRVFFG
jgi:hypothetical protein